MEDITKRGEEWASKLEGKTLISVDKESSISKKDLDSNVFFEKDLPKPYRLIGPNQMVTRDFRPDRLNVNYKDEKDGKMIIESVNFG